jgi:8-oxo-dGTP diphosphatase
MEMDWSSWTPRERANLCFILKNRQLLLIRKKRGLGAGKINAPGGKIEPGETALQSAIRETQEEVGVTPLGVVKSGELFFQFADGYSLHCTVFLASDLEGDPVETDEADPFWVHCEAVPYEEMWEDDQHWLPAMLEGKNFVGYFTFDGDRMLSRDVRFESREAAPGGAPGGALGAA